jgi:hypothetical protein
MTDTPFEEGQSPVHEPGEPEIMEDGPPGKLEFAVAVYGWMRHVHLEIENLERRMRVPAISHEDAQQIVGAVQHIHATFNEALRELELYVPEDARDTAAERAAVRRDAMLAFPLPPFPTQDEMPR